MNKQILYMGVSALHHDSSASLIDSQGNIIAVSQEERRTKIKNDSSWPTNSIEFCLTEAKNHGIDVNSDNLEWGYYEYPWMKFSRRFWYNPRCFIKHLREAKLPGQYLKGKRVHYVKHHLSHALAGCATSPFSESIYLTIDAIGEWDTTTWGCYNSTSGLVQHGSIQYPHSLGILYSAFTRWLGLKPNEDEYIVMGAAAHGKPKYTDKIWEFIGLNFDGTFFLKKNIHRGIETYMPSEVPVHDWYDWCASVQSVTETCVLALCEKLYKKYGKIPLVLGGGVALNCVANKKIIDENWFEDIWILPSPGDSGNSLGAAVHAAGLNKIKWKDAFLGSQIEANTDPCLDLISEVLRRLESGEVIGWIQGREEFGPRALGHRSLVADPRIDGIKDKVNSIKRRQDFRPFAPAVLEEDADLYFDAKKMNPYMQFIARVRNPAYLPGISHIDNTARVQTVPKSQDPFRRLLEQWKRKTDCSVLLNTSLNIKGQPLISSRVDAMKMLLENEKMDSLVIGNCLYYKTHKAGLDEGHQWIAECVDYSQGTDNMIAGRF